MMEQWDGRVRSQQRVPALHFLAVPDSELATRLHCTKKTCVLSSALRLRQW
jgi:hypothetical protein